MRYLAVAVLAVVAIALPECASSSKGTSGAATPDAIDAKMVSEMKAGHIPGMSVAVIKDGRVVKLAGYGLADVKKATPATSATIYQTGSIGKQFTAFAVMLLVAEGKIGLEDPITKYLGDHARWRGITVRQLLTHTSGITNAALDDVDYSVDSNEDEMVKTLAAAPLTYPPGTKWKYSNAGYALLGVIIHRASGQFYGDFLKERVWQPLGMTSTQIIDQHANLPRLAAGYNWEKNELKPDDEQIAPFWDSTADGSMYTTVEDMTKWAIALDQQRLLPPSGYKEIYTPVTLRNGKTHAYGFGWFLETDDAGNVYDHDGTWQGYSTYITRHVDAHVDAIVLTNLGDSDDVDTIGEDLAKAYIQ